MPSLPTYGKARDKFFDILNGNRSDKFAIKANEVDLLIDQLESKKESIRFADFVYNLRTLDLNHSLRDKSKTTAVRINTGRGIQTDSALFLDEGGFGALFKSTSKNIIYKYILLRPDDDAETFIRETFLESWVQIVLGLDTKYGKQIAQITGIYRSPFTVRTTDSNAPIELYITMDPIRYTFKDMTATMAKRNEHLIEPSELLPILGTIAKLLLHFNSNYNFFHRDLHSGNVMYDEDFNPILIDFGMCCMKFYNSKGKKIYYSKFENDESNPIAYKVIEGKKDPGCFSFDILIFLTSIFESGSSSANLSFETKMFLYLCMCSDDGNVRLFDFLSDLQSRLGEAAVFHTTYYWNIASYSLENKAVNEAINKVKTIRLKHFLAACKNYTKFVKGHADLIDTIKSEIHINPALTTLRKGAPKGPPVLRVPFLGLGVRNAISRIGAKRLAKALNAAVSTMRLIKGGARRTLKRRQPKYRFTRKH